MLGCRNRLAYHLETQIRETCSIKVKNTLKFLLSRILISLTIQFVSIKIRLNYSNNFKYLPISLTKILEPTNSKLTISSDGNLVILNSSKNIVWSTNINSFTSNTKPIIMDSGNLVLRASTNTSDILWQSIEHPADTWLPGGKLAQNKLTGVSQQLASWKNSDDPSPGSYSLEIDPDGSSQYSIQWNHNIIFWNSGLWDGTIFANLSEMTQVYVYTFKYVTHDPQENYFTYSVKTDSTINSRFVIDVWGQIRQFTWIPVPQQWYLFCSQPKVQCDV